MAVTKWYLSDPLDATSHVFLLNPTPKGRLGELDTDAELGEAVQTDLGAVLVMKQNKIQTAEFTVDCLVDAERTTLWSWWQKNHILTLTDDLTQINSIFLTQLVDKRLRKASIQTYATVACSYLIVSSQQPARLYAIDRAPAIDAAQRLGLVSRSASDTAHATSSG